MGCGLSKSAQKGFHPSGLEKITFIRSSLFTVAEEIPELEESRRREEGGNSLWDNENREERRIEAENLLI